MSIQHQAFSCLSNGKTVRGIEYRPASEGLPKLPIAIVSHGFLADLKTTRRYAKRLAEWGFCAYCFDFCGGGPGSSSDGKLSEMTVLTEKDDLKAVIAHAQAQPYTDAGRVTLMGCSQGGFVSALVAADLGAAVERLILFYPALCIPDDARRGKMMMFEFDPKHIPETLQAGPLTLSGQYAACMLGMDPFAEIAAYPGLVLLVHGTADRLVLPRYSQQALAAYEAQRPGRAQLVLIRGAGHGFGSKADRRALVAVQVFLRG